MESQCNKTANVGELERIASGVMGGLLIGCGARHLRGLTGLSLLALGGALLYRAASGNCAVYRALGIDRNQMPECPAEVADIYSEDSFPASDPPAWTSASASRSGGAEFAG